MKFKIVLFAAVALLLVTFMGFYVVNKKRVNESPVLIGVMMEGINAMHYQPEEIDDAFSKKVYSLYLKRLDFTKRFLTESDVAKLKPFETQIDDQVKNRSYEFFDLSEKIITTRIDQAKHFYKDLLDKPFDFTAKDSMETDGEKIIFAKDSVALKDAWRKYFKYQTLISLNELMDIQEKAKEKKDTAVKIKSAKELEAEARKKVLKSNDDFFNRMSELEKSDWLSLYLNAIANTEDPHTEYFPPQDKQNFDILMSGQLEGIGAQLQQTDGNIKVTSIVVGSPSYRQGQLKAGDIIIKVGQGKDEPVNVEGMRLDKAVALIRGKKGTEVRLTVKKPDATILIISIIRDVVVLEETYAQSFILNGKEKVGYLKLPSFYTNMDNKSGRKSAQDVRKELEKLKSENVNGVILDLRDNGGGSLQDAVDMAGLFIKSGPIVQVKSKSGGADILSDGDPDIIYDGPLAILVNQNSASTSEILAAAMQDYKRAVIIGSNATFGKGTVQRFFNLDDFVSEEFKAAKPLGSIKITLQKFYRISGASTQLKGVTPDIILPDAYSDLEDLGEKDQDYPLGWDVIGGAPYETWTKSLDISKLKSASNSRIASSNAFTVIKKRARELKYFKSHSKVTLNLQEFRNDQLKKKEDKKKSEEIEKQNSALEITNLQVDMAAIQADSTRIARNKEMEKNLKKDIYLYEADNIINEMK